MRPQIDLAKDNGLDFFIFDTYIGLKNGQWRPERIKPLEEAFIPSLKDNEDFEFANMLCFDSSRVIMPFGDRDTPELERRFDFDFGAIHQMVDYCFEKYWKNPHYLKINGKPYVAIWPPHLQNNPVNPQTKD
jgi:hypothetical protein